MSNAKYFYEIEEIKTMNEQIRRLDRENRDLRETNLQLQAEVDKLKEFKKFLEAGWVELK